MTTGLLFNSYISATRLAMQSLMHIDDVERVLRVIFSHKMYFSFQSDMKFGKRPVCELKLLKNWTALCLFLAVALLLYHDPFLLLWWPMKPAEVR